MTFENPPETPGLPRTALVACSRLVDFAGAEIASLELAEALRDLGVAVTLAALEVGPLIEAEMRSRGLSWRLMCAGSRAGDTPEPSSVVAPATFDLVWLSHSVMAYHVFVNEKVQARCAVYASLSHFEPLEAPPLPALAFSRYVVHSEENRQFFRRRYPHLADRLALFPNAAPAEFFEAARLAPPALPRAGMAPVLQSVLIVSNHPPVEVLDLAAMLRERGLTVDLLGSQGQSRRVGPALLGAYSAVITIGKTVQYALVTGLPVFCYDHFGGPGWLAAENVEAAFEKNFSGRCTPQTRSAPELLADFMGGFAAACKQREALAVWAKARFDLRANLLQLLASATSVPMTASLSSSEQQVLSRQSALFMNQRSVISNYQQTLEQERQELARQQARAHLEREQLEGEQRQALAAKAAQLAELEAEIALLRQQARGLDIDMDLLRQQACELDAEVDLLRQQAGDLARDHAQLQGQQSRQVEQMTSLLNSTSWRLTAPLRWLVTTARVWRARSGVLAKRSDFVLRHEGLSGFGVRTLRFVHRTVRRQWAARQCARQYARQYARLGAAELRPERPSGPPRVSFVIPIHDRTDVLRVAIESALAQSVTDLEVLLITDGSPAATLAVVESFRSDPRVKIFSYPVSSGNAVRGRNKGILEARGQYIAFLDSDDIAAPDRLARCLPLLESGAADVVYGDWRALLDGSREVDGLTQGQVVHSPDCDLALLQKICVPCQSTVMVRRASLLDAGFLKPCMQYREDHELWVRLASRGARFKSVPHVLTDLRLHAGNNELNFKSQDAHWESMLRTQYLLPGPRPQKVAFLLAGLGISGGAAVVLKHVSMLMAEGQDAFVIDLGGHGTIDWFGHPEIRVQRISDMPRYELDNIDLLVATFWTTFTWLEKIPSRRKLYLVQSDERLFYDDPALKQQVAQTYQGDCDYLTIAPWLVEMLDREFGQHADYIPNGLDLALFYPGQPLQERNPGRLRVLIEGPISVPFKGMADAHAAISALDCEIWIVSSDGAPEPGWRHDRFFHGVSQQQMRGIYASCDVLLKMSRIESFAYPPLEAMACACTVVLGEVRGGIDYAVHEENVLKVPMGDVVAARAAVQRLLRDEPLRDKLRRHGLATARRWTWEASQRAMLSVVLADEAPGFLGQRVACSTASSSASSTASPEVPFLAPFVVDSGAHSVTPVPPGPVASSVRPEAGSDAGHAALAEAGALAKRREALALP